jgi:hypothetical protein
MNLTPPAQSSTVEFLHRPKVIDYKGWPSPFDDDGVQYAWDSTSLGLLKTCPRKYQLSMVLNWQPKKRSYHLEFGIYYHSAIEWYEKQMALWSAADEPSRQEWHEITLRSTIRKALIDSFGYEPGDDLKTGNQKNDKTRFNLIRSLVWYFEQFGLNDPCETVILTNGKPAVELSFRFDIGGGILLSGHLDRIVTYGDGTYVMDHKTTASTVTGASARYFFKNFNPDNQMSLYSVGAAIAFATPVKGVIIDAAQVAVGFTAFGRDFTHRTERQLHEFLEGVHSYRRQAEIFTRDGFWPMNESACGNYGGCQFRDICSKDPAVRERFLLTDFTQDHPWNPLEPR